MVNKKWIFLLCVLLIECLSPTQRHYWNLEWEIRDKTDSTLVKNELVSSVTVIPDHYNDNPFIDTVVNGKLFAPLDIGGDKASFLRESPFLYAKISAGNKLLIDTSFSWDSLNFKIGKDKWGNEGNMVSYKSFYIDTVN